MKPSTLVLLPESDCIIIQYLDYLQEIQQGHELEIVVVTDNIQFLAFLNTLFKKIYVLKKEQNSLTDKYKYFVNNFDKIKYEFYLDLSNEQMNCLLTFPIVAENKITARPLNYLTKKIFAEPIAVEGKFPLPYFNKDRELSFNSNDYILINFQTSSDVIKYFYLIERLADALVETKIAISYHELIVGDVDVIAEWMREKSLQKKIVFEKEFSIKKILNLIKMSYLFIAQERWIYELSKKLVREQLLLEEIGDDFDFGRYLEKIEEVQGTPSETELL